MGICGSKEKDNFSTPGRTLASAPPPKPTSSKIPASATTSSTKPPPQRVGGAGHTVGGAGAGAASDPRAAAAQAAEARLQNAKGKGKLGEQLDKQKKQTMNATRAAEAEENLRRRDTDRAAELGRYN